MKKKKINLLMLLSLLLISVFAVDANKKFNFQETDPEQIEVHLKSKKIHQMHG